MIEGNKLVALAVIALGYLLNAQGLSANMPKEGSPLISGLDLSEQSWFDSSLPFETRVEALIEAMTLEEKTSQLLNQSVAIERLGIPAYDWWNEALHGVARSGKATIFPQAIGLAATFDPETLERVGSTISDEARAIYNDSLSRNRQSIRYMGLTFWSPNVNIFRDPRWGRGQETYGEDPFLTGSLGAAFIRGMQGDDPRYLKTAACAKHYAVHSGPEALRHEFNAKTSLKDLRETYLPAFEMCVEAGVESIMCAYNRTNDQPCCGSDELLADILRGEWGFEGQVVSDCWALENFHKKHGTTLTVEESAALAIKSGVDLNCGDTYRVLVNAYDQGLITEAEIDERLRTNLMIRFRLGMFDPGEGNPYRQIPPSVAGSEENRQLALEVARKSIVLLQNKAQALPLEKDLPFVYLGGPFAGDVRSLIGNYHGLNDQLVTLVEGVVGKTSPSTRMQYRTGSLAVNPNRNSEDWFSGQAKEADATIVGLGLTILLEGEEGEAIASNAKGDNLSMMLPEVQLKYLRKVAGMSKEGGKKLIVVVFAGCPLDLSEVCELADAVLYAWYPGQEGGRALADIIFGDVSPSGKLPITFPRSPKDLPPYDDYSMKGRTYKFMEKEPLFPFGFGLSYANFEVGLIQADRSAMSASENIKITVPVVNHGAMEAEEVIQLYVSLPRIDESIPKSSLKAVRRVRLPALGTKELVFELNSEMFTYFDSSGAEIQHKGPALVSVGNASPGARSEALGADLESYMIVCN